MLFGELQRPGETLPKRMAQTLIRHYGERLRGLLEAGKAQGELHAALDPDAAATLFIGTIQGLVMQSMLSGDVARIRSDEPGVFALYLPGIGAASCRASDRPARQNGSYFLLLSSPYSVLDGCGCNRAAAPVTPSTSDSRPVGK